VRDENANEICAKILLLAAEDSEKDIYLYINSPGGSITAGMAIYDTMQFVPNDIVTVGIGMAASMGQLLLTAGTKGKRYITPNARVLLHQPHGGFGGTASDIQTQAQLILDMKKRLAEITPPRPASPSSRSTPTATGIAGSPPRRPWRTASSTTSASRPPMSSAAAAPRTEGTENEHAHRRHPAGLQMPSSRYILPQFEERTAYGYKRQDPYNKLFEDRIIFLGVQVDDASADDVMAQLLVLESQDPDRDIIMYINSPGGSFTAMTAIYDTMQFVSPEIQTVVLGQAASAASVLLAAGAPGKRLALPNARILMHQPAVGESGHGQASDIEIQAAEIMRMRTWLEETMARHTNRTQEQVHKDIDRDKILSASEALEYGVVDQVLTSRKRVPAALTS
jgi:ATP-dependent Clp protease protease subunit